MKSKTVCILVCTLLGAAGCHQYYQTATLKTQLTGVGNQGEQALTKAKEDFRAQRSKVLEVDQGPHGSINRRMRQLKMRDLAEALEKMRHARALQRGAEERFDELAQKRERIRQDLPRGKAVAKVQADHDAATQKFKTAQARYWQASRVLTQVLAQ